MSETSEGPGGTLSPSQHSRVKALVHLLGDDDTKICAVAWDHLASMGEAVLPFVRAASQQTEDHRVRVHARRFLAEWERRVVFEQWVAFCRRDRLDLEEGAFLIMRSEYPQTEIDPYRQTLERYARGLGSRVRSSRTVGDAVSRLSHFLFAEEGFRGDVSSYYSADNSYLNRVLELKKGIPLSLAVLMLLVARRLSIPIHGVNMPQHFLLKYREPAGEVFVDVFHGGKLLAARDCARFLGEAGITFRDEHLRGVSDRVILQRMLGNLLRVYLADEDERRSGRVAAMLKLLD